MSALDILQTKLTPPPLRPDRVHRPRLAQRFGKSPDSRLTLVCAPAGYGKSTLLSEWFGSEAATPVPFGWLSLDEDDNDPVRFLIYLISAFANASRLDTGEMLALLHSPQPPPPKTILTALITRLESASSPIAVALDDYHVITTQTIHDAMTYLLDHLPAHVFMVVTSREDPPFPLARLRGRGQLAEIRADDLRFTLDEIEQFLRQTLGADLNTAQVKDLDARTEGWVAGLQLAALAMKDRRDLDRFIAAFTGSHRYILDYLSDEVLNRQPEAIRTFLLQTSILDRLSGPLCDAITGRTDGQAQLEQLERNNLFLIPLDDERYWFRYHHLFADILKRQLLHTTPTLVNELHRRASRWFAAAGLVDEAVSHALEAADFEMAASILEDAGDRYFVEGWGNFGMHWVTQLPFEVTHRHILLSLNIGMWHSYHGEGRLALKHVDAARTALATAEKPPEETEELLGYADTIEALAASLIDDIDRASIAAENALRRLPADQYRLRTSALLVRGFIYQLQLKLDDARRAYALVIEAGQVMNDVAITTRALVHTGDSFMIEGRLRDAEVVYQRCIQLAQRAGRGQVTSVANAYAGLSCVQLEKNRLAEAAQSATRCIEHYELAPILPYLLVAQAVLVRAADLMGNAEVFQRAVQGVRNLLETYPAMPARITAFYTGRLWEVEALSGLFERVIAEQQSSLTSPQESHLLQLYTVHRLLARNDPDVLADVFAALDDLALQAGHTSSIARQIEMLILRTHALALSNQREQALKTLAQALDLAEPNGYVRMFVDQGMPMRELLREARVRGIATDYVSRLLSAFEAEPAGLNPAPEKAPAHSELEPLSDREMEVLRLMADGASNREIAEALFISIGTVKKHSSNIFIKLDARSRTQAIVNARKYNIL